MRSRTSGKKSIMVSSVRCVGVLCLTISFQTLTDTMTMNQLPDIRLSVPAKRACKIIRKRFELSDQLYAIMVNTITRMGWSNPAVRGAGGEGE